MESFEFYEYLGEGWGVRVIDNTKTEYSKIITSINKKYVTNMVYTFASCTELTVAPEIPRGAITLSSTFAGCTSLTTMPDMSKAVNLRHLDNTFYKCTSLKNVTIIPNSVINMNSTFYNCTVLDKSPIIPNSVINMEGTFHGCKALKTAPIISNNVTNMRYTFYECIALKGEIEINANPTEYDSCFANTKESIKIIGTATAETKVALAGTASGNVTY